MAAPTFNKYRSTSVFGALQVRDFTNSAGTSVIEVASTDLSGNFLSRGDSTFTKAITCNGTITNGTHLTTKTYVDSAVSGGSILGLNNTFTGANLFNNNVDVSGNFSIINATNFDNSFFIIDENDVVKINISPNGINQTNPTAENTYNGTSYFQNILSQQDIILPSGIQNTFIKTYFNEGIDVSGNSTFNKNFPTSTLPTSTAITNNSIVNKGMNDTLYSSVANQVKTNTANAFTSTNTFNSNFPTSTLPTSTAITNNSIVNVGMNNTIYSSIQYEVKTNTDNTYTGQNIYSNNVFCNSILDVRPSQSTPSSFRVAIGDIESPTLPTASAEQFKQIGELIITQATPVGTPQTETIDYNTDSSIIASYNIPVDFTKNITFNLPVGIRNTGTCVNTGTASSFTITNLFNSLEVKVYVNGVFITTITSANTTIMNSNSNTRSSTISYTSTGTKSITLNQYFFNVNVDLTQYLDNDFFVRDNGITNTLTLFLKANITNTLARVSNTGNFTATINTALIANTSTSTFSGTFGTDGSATYSPNSNGTNYAGASFISQYRSLFDTTGTTYANYLRINKLWCNFDAEIEGTTTLSDTNIIGVATLSDTTNLTGTFVIANDGYITQTGTGVNSIKNLTLTSGNLTMETGRVNLPTDDTLTPATSANQLGHRINGTITGTIASNTQVNLSAITLPFGIYIVVGNVVFQSNATAGTITKYQIGFNNTSGTSFTSSVVGYGGTTSLVTTASNTTQLALTTTEVVSITSASQSFRLIANITYATTTMSINTTLSKFTAVRIA